MRIGIFGGTFNPIHIGHMHIAHSAMNDLDLNYVFFVPSKMPYGKFNSELQPYYYRKEMVKLAIKNDGRFLLGVDGCKPAQNTYTYLTVRHYKTIYPTYEIYLIVGEDAFVDMCTWKEYLEIFKNINGIYVYRRNKSLRTIQELKELYPVQNIHIATEKLEISSTMIREKLYQESSCKYLLPNGVYDYIRAHKLYQTKGNEERK